MSPQIDKAFFYRGVLTEDYADGADKAGIYPPNRRL
jgi:hypothetical protein